MGTMTTCHITAIRYLTLYPPSLFGKLDRIYPIGVFNILEIFLKPWPEASQEAFCIRQQVFIEEQGVPAEMELDEFDPGAQHVLVYEGNYCIATARLVHLSPQDAQIGRMAVLQEYRERGVGMALLKRLIDLAGSQGISRLVLHSQVSAIPFYEKVGFVSEGPIYDEAGIPHRNMMLLLPKTTSSFCHP